MSELFKIDNSNCARSASCTNHTIPTDGTIHTDGLYLPIPVDTEGNSISSPSTVPSSTGLPSTDPLSGLTWQLGFETDIGGGGENQDECFVWSHPTEKLCVLCVLDGHGREVGRIAAVAAKGRLLRFFEESFNELAADPVQTLIRAHDVAHDHIKATFKSELENQGFQVMEDPQAPYLLKRRSSVQVWAHVHGGTSCSIVALVGSTMYIANVGDSTGTLCCNVPVLSRSMIDYIGDAGVEDAAKHEAKVAEVNAELLSDTTASDTIMITSDHSPENLAEFHRLREFKQRDGDPQQPALLVVYDYPATDKIHCPPVFEVLADGTPRIAGRPKYYKNVRKEWASLVSTPHTARFQDALAFTRSLGDLHLSTYGVTNMPEVQKIELNKVYAAMDAYAATADTTNAATASEMEIESSSSGKCEASVPPPMLCVVLATDGVWDNWEYADVTKFVLDGTCIKAVSDCADGAQRVALSLMQRNAHYAKKNFGRSADNATGIVMYLTRR